MSKQFFDAKVKNVIRDRNILPYGVLSRAICSIFKCGESNQN